jgi:deoxycytidylate deaminase
MNYFELCARVARTSHDPDTKLGCVIVDEQGTVASSGSNRFEREQDITPERLQRPLKYEWIKHAEVNAIAGKTWAGHTLYCSAHPCKGCAEAIVAAGIAKVLVPGVDDPGLIARWQSSWDAADLVLERGGATVEYVDFK